MTSPARTGMPRSLDPIGRILLVAVVAVGVLASVTMNDAPATGPENLAIVTLGLLFLAGFLLLGERLDGLSDPARVGYFALQLGLAGAMFATQARLGSFGMAWIVLLPLLVQAVFVWPWPAVAGVALAVVVLPVVHVAFLAGLAAAAEVAIGVGAGTAFVLLFSAASLRERTARTRSEELAGELAAANQRLAELYLAADELAATRERNRLAREIHDSLGHVLTVINVQLESARVLLGDRPREAEVRIDRAARLVREGLNEVRRSVSALRSGPLEDEGLEAAVERLVDDAGTEGLATGLEIRGTPRALPADVAVTLYRAVQEGLTNVRKHAEAGRVRVRLDFVDDGRVAVEVEDDGVGAEVPEEGFGLLGLRERARALDGELRVRTAPGEGLTLALELPS